MYVIIIKMHGMYKKKWCSVKLEGNYQMCCTYRTVAYIEPLRISNRCIYRTVSYIKPLLISNRCIYRTVAYIEPLHISNPCVYRTVAYIEPLHISNRCGSTTLTAVKTYDDSTHGVPKHVGRGFVHLLCMYSGACKVGFIPWYPVLLSHRTLWQCSHNKYLFKN